MPIVLIDNRQVARKIGRSYLYLKKSRRRLQENYNFPNYVLRGLTDEAAVDAWLAAGGMNQKKPPPPERPPRRPDAEARQRQANRNLDRLKR